MPYIQEGGDFDLYVCSDKPDFNFSLAPCIPRDTDFDLYSCLTPTTDFNLKECFIYGKIVALSYTGCSSESGYIQHSTVFNCDINNGSYHDINISVTITLNFDSFGNQTSLTDLKVPPVAFIEQDEFNGLYSENPLYTSVVLSTDQQSGQILRTFVNTETTFNIDGNNGLYGELTLKTFPPILLGDNYLIGGQYYNDANLSTSVLFIPESFNNGQWNRSTVFVPDLYIGYSGGSSKAETIDLPVSPSFEFTPLYTGQLCTLNDTFPTYQTIEPSISRVGQRCYDGIGRAGGINLCDINPENVSKVLTIYDINFSQYDRPVSSDCPVPQQTTIISLLTNPRFKFDNYQGTSISTYLPQKYLGFGLGDDDPILYADHIKIYNPVLLECIHSSNTVSVNNMNINDDDFLALNGSSSSTVLDKRAFALFLNENNIQVNISFEDHDYKSFFEVYGVGQSSFSQMQGENNFYYCPDYLMPMGDHAEINFDPYEIVTDNCDDIVLIVDSYSRSRLNSTEVLLACDYYSGQVEILNNNGFYAPSHRLGEFLSYCGQNCYTYQPPQPDSHWNSGQYMQFEFKVDPYIGYNAQICYTRDLHIPEPDIKFLTPSGCLVNQYHPLDEYGDYDTSFIQEGFTIEGSPFYSRIDATCVTDYTDDKLRLNSPKVSNTGGYSESDLFVSQTMAEMYDGIGGVSQLSYTNLTTLGTTDIVLTSNYNVNYTEIDLNILDEPKEIYLKSDFINGSYFDSQISTFDGFNGGNSQTYLSTRVFWEWWYR